MIVFLQAISLYRDPNGAKIFSSSNTGMKNNNVVTDPYEKIKMLCDQVKVLEGRLKRESQSEMVNSYLTQVRWNIQFYC